MKVALISDIHGNIEAFDAVLDSYTSRGVGACYCDGDIVGYGASPAECTRALMRLHIHTVMGNHDNYVILVKLGHALSPIFELRDDVIAGIRYAARSLDADELDFLLGLPMRHEEVAEGRRLLFVHGTPYNSLADYDIFHDMTSEDVQEDMLLKAGYPDVLVMGHSHYPSVTKFDGKLIVNPGSVGQPRDKDPRASYAILDTGGMDAEIVRVPYDIEAAARRIIKAGLPRFSADRLSLGK